jgi:hypothetical protein
MIHCAERKSAKKNLEGHATIVFRTGCGYPIEPHKCAQSHQNSRYHAQEQSTVIDFGAEIRDRMTEQ